MEYPIIASNINDFIFCPASIYFHNLFKNQDVITYQNPAQINGTNAHRNLDKGAYSTAQHMLSGVEAYTEEFNILCKIDLYDSKNGILTERKKKVHQLYDGQIFQVYAQCFALRELGFNVKKIRIHSMDDNNNYDLKLPEEDLETFKKFKRIIQEMNRFDLASFKQDNAQKCKNCIYESSCGKSII